jgi:hypothetical protein
MALFILLVILASCTQKEFSYYIILNMEHDAKIHDILLDLKTKKDMRDNVDPEVSPDISLPLGGL